MSFFIFSSFFVTTEHLIHFSVCQSMFFVLRYFWMLSSWPCYDFDFLGNGSIAALEKVVHMSEPSTLAGFLSGFRYTSPPLAGGFLVFIYMLVATSRPYRHLVALEVKIIGI